MAMKRHHGGVSIKAQLPFLIGNCLKIGREVNEVSIWLDEKRETNPMPNVHATSGWNGERFLDEWRLLPFSQSIMQISLWHGSKLSAKRITICATPATAKRSLSLRQRNEWTEWRLKVIISSHDRCFNDHRWIMHSIRPLSFSPHLVLSTSRTASRDNCVIALLIHISSMKWIIGFVYRFVRAHIQTMRYTFAYITHDNNNSTIKWPLNRWQKENLWSWQSLQTFPFLIVLLCCCCCCCFLFFSTQK